MPLRPRDGGEAFETGSRSRLGNQGGVETSPTYQAYIASCAASRSASLARIGGSRVSSGSIQSIMLVECHAIDLRTLSRPCGASGIRTPQPSLAAQHGGACGVSQVTCIAVREDNVRLAHRQRSGRGGGCGGGVGAGATARARRAARRQGVPLGERLPRRRAPAATRVPVQFFRQVRALHYPTRLMTEFRGSCYNAAHESS